MAVINEENCAELKELLENIQKLKGIIKEKKAEVKIQESILKEAEERFISSIQEKLDDSQQGIFFYSSAPKPDNSRTAVVALNDKNR